MGIRGIPANYGGFETFAEELAPRLVAKGHEVTVYGRSHYIDRSRHNTYYRGVRLLILPTFTHKYLDTVFHTFLTACHGLSQDFDVVFICNAANSPFAFLPRLNGAKVVLNVDGIERLRKKWNYLGKAYYRIGEFLATVFPHAIVADARVIQDYYLRMYGKPATMIPYGATVGRVESREVLDRFGVQPQEYLLYVSRLEPENNVHLVIEAFKQVETAKKLVIVGDAPYSEGYKNHLQELAAGDERIIFTGYVFGQGYKEFQSHAYAYVMAMEVGGTHPSLVEAMGFGNCVIVNGTPENVEVVGDAALVYRKNDITDMAAYMRLVLADPALVKSYQMKAQARINKYYSWEAVTDAYEALFVSLVNSSSGRPACSSSSPAYQQ